MRRTTVPALLALATGVMAFGAPVGRVVLCTDYGVDSVYVGILKGVIYDKFPDARVDSLTNAIPPFDIEAGARILAEGCAVYPPGTVFCCVVDPGVGTSRKGVVLETDTGQVFVAPDNGLLTLVAERDGVRALHEIANAAIWREGALSSTFHGRDIFGPVAATIAPTSIDAVAGYKGDAPVAAGEAFDPTPANLEARTERVRLDNGMRREDSVRDIGA
ncbi:MAG TPA: SAM-dependent chlorinase/fluorinase, partial [Candidatus Hydrogenedentes bacterium]|nr:SAM-dependent chlorinase/fluorinase [Candidatus Hydrogenedentota bacterium]